MNISFTAGPLRSSSFACFYTNSSTSNPPRLRRNNTAVPIIPARDRVIDFGKYKGRMLGTLPSNYLKWVSKNLRARDFLEWAKRCDEVLTDPVYIDRIEWEFAERILNGDVLSKSTAIGDEDAVSLLLDISERFGWDNDDREGWKKIDFELLGSSKGGRIPRIGSQTKNVENKVVQKLKYDNKISVEGDGERRRRERRERRKSKSSASTTPPFLRPPPEAEMKQSGISEYKNELKIVANEQEEAGKTSTPFPGREAFLKKIINIRQQKNLQRNRIM